MANTVIFQNTKIWRNDIKTDSGEFYTYSISVSNRNQDGSWDSVYLPIRFSRSAEAPEKISNGTTADLEGFLTVRKRKTGKNEVQLMVTRYNSQDEEYPVADDLDIPDSFAQAESDIPF